MDNIESPTKADKFICYPTKDDEIKLKIKVLESKIPHASVLDKSVNEWFKHLRDNARQFTPYNPKYIGTNDGKQIREEGLFVLCIKPPRGSKVIDECLEPGLIVDINKLFDYSDYASKGIECLQPRIVSSDLQQLIPKDQNVMSYINFVIYRPIDPKRNDKYTPKDLHTLYRHKSATCCPLCGNAYNIFNNTEYAKYYDNVRSKLGAISWPLCESCLKDFPKRSTCGCPYSSEKPVLWFNSIAMDDTGPCNICNVIGALSADALDDVSRQSTPNTSEIPRKKVKRDQGPIKK
jgi:hypothetical protein